MFAKLASLGSAFLLGIALLTPAVAADRDEQSGVVRVRSAYPIAETIARIRQDIEAKGIKFFTAIDQAQLAAEAKIELRPSTLLIFGNPPLGTQFLTSNPDAGLDWPVRLLVREDENRTVWAVYTDFDWLARRYGIRDRDAQFEMAAAVIGSITSAVAEK